jgi:type IV pilus assembly protein PilW
MKIQISTYTRKHKGFTLIEFLIAMLISTAMIGGIIQIFSNSKQMFRHQTELSTVLENGRFTTIYLSSMLRQAGLGIANGALTGCDGKTNLSCKVNYKLDKDSAATNNDITGDFVQVQYKSLPDSITDCSGASDNVIDFTNTFFVAPDTNNGNILTLFCLSSASNEPPSPIISHIESMQISYGLDTDAPADNVANKYLTADNITNVQFENIVSLRIGILISAQSSTRSSNDTETYDLAGQQIDSAAFVDPRLFRRAFNVTVKLRNRNL